MKIGILGGGQLGRMLALAGYPLGLRFRLFDPQPDAAAGQVAELVTGAYDDRAALERFADGLDVITYEFENVPAATLEYLAARVPVYPPPRALACSQDRLAEKTLFRTLDIPTAEFAPVDSPADLTRALEHVGLPAILKTRHHGYDGLGQVVIRTAADADSAFAALAGRPLIVEGRVPFDREVSVLAARGRSGETVVYPLVENRHERGVLIRSLAPAPHTTDDLRARAVRKIERLLHALDYVGVLTLEMFEVQGRLWANELAARVHNSGHWSIDAGGTSQFENHLRAVAGWPLGDPQPRGSAALLNLIGGLPPVAELLATRGVHLHLYGKEPRPGRKLGHVTVCGGDEEVAAGLRVIEPLVAAARVLR